ncbi:plakophilin-1 isoform X2 [Corythoichthys intestinalis]|uniref:plakophilin-1 isoform X2 n=1 Tax=Corythoichthys intestinalis TaxID=161448 RepID=UPI0025A502A8|nr:plakophilin-1 isoform X2 [Corythoichthys intestinalis]
MLAEPLRSAVTAGRTEDTSLALPSDASLHTGAHRVLDQVQTVKRSKSKHGPTLPALSTLDEFRTFQFLPTNANGTSGRSNSTKSTAYNKLQYSQKSRSLSTKSLGSRHHSSSGGWEQQINISNWPQSPVEMKPSRSDPALGPASMRRVKGQLTQSQVKRVSTYSTSNGIHTATGQQRFIDAPPDQAQSIKTSKIEQQSAINNAPSISDLTIKEAVEFLSHPEEKFQQCGATVIQQVTFKEDSAKQEVLQLGGIPTLVNLLRSQSPAVSQAAAGALRNLVFKNQNNKLQVQHCGGIAKALQLLKETECSETQKQITGLLWNLSSADELKGELIATALPALTENVVVPFTRWSDDSVTNNIHPEVFYNTTGCLRNLSCAQLRERAAMRDCRGLIDSLMCYLQSCVADDNPDDKSVENCACILHNLTYQLEAESPKCFADFIPSTENQSGRKSPTVGCFSPKSSKVQQQFSFDAVRGMLDDADPKGAKWLCHPKAMQTYLSLLGSSQKDATLEACCGALQNLTASKHPGSSAMSQILVQKLGALVNITPLLRSQKQSLQKAAVSLLGNIGRTSSLQASMAKQVLPELAGLLSAGPRELGNSDESVATACNTVRNLMMADTEANKKFIDSDLVSSLADLSGNGAFPKGSKAASVLLYHLWNDKNLQNVLKKLGMSKSLFVNDSTTAAYRSVQIIE